MENVDGTRKAGSNRTTTVIMLIALAIMLGVCGYVVAICWPVIGPAFLFFISG